MNSRSTANLAVASPLLVKLELHSILSVEQKHALEEATRHKRSVQARESIVEEGDRPTVANLIVEGFACRYKLLPDGRRQITSFHIPGDLCDLLSFPIRTLDHGLATISPCVIAPIPHRELEALLQTHPGLMMALWRETLIDGAIFREWMVGMGRRSAYARVAHLLCEVIVRMRAVGLADGNRCTLPLTQTDLADALGLSVVHTNRVLQRLRAEGLITLRSFSLSVDNWLGLRRAGEFDPGYLHLARDR